MPSSLPQVGDGILVCAVLFANSPGGGMSCADSRGNTYVLNQRNSFGASSIYTSCMFYCSQVTSALQNGDTITITQSIGSAVIQLAAFKAAHVTAYDTGAGNDNNATSASAGLGASTTLATNDELGVIMVATEAAGLPMTDPTGYSASGLTVIDGFNGASHIYYQLWQKELVGLAGSYAPPTVSLNGSTTWTYGIEPFEGTSGCVLTYLGQTGGVSVSGVSPSLALVDTGLAAPAIVRADLTRFPKSLMRR